MPSPCEIQGQEEDLPWTINGALCLRHSLFGGT